MAEAIPTGTEVSPCSTVAAFTTQNVQPGFRSTSSAMASIPRFFAKIASLGYIGTEIETVASVLPQPAEALATNANSIDNALIDATFGNGTTDSPSVGGAAFEGGVRGVGSVFAYVTSKWAVLCLFMIVLLNRTLIYASLRRPIQLPFRIRLFMRIVPISMLGYQIFQIVLAMRCQSSQIFQGERNVVVISGHSDFFFHAISKVGSWWLDDHAVCEWIGMIPDSDWIDQASNIKDTKNPEALMAAPSGSLTLLWPLYKTLSLSQFVEVFACSLAGRLPASETGMTLLEYSLAFAEAEALATRKTYRLENTPGDSEEGAGSFKIKGEKLVPVEVLYIALISSMSHATSHIMAIFNRQSKYRLITTGIYGIAFLGGFSVALLQGGASGILEFPTVSVVGFVPHLLIFAAISICAGIYGMALLLTSLFPPSGNSDLNEGFNNLRANLTLSSIAVSLSEDFYTVLLKLGFMCLTAASEATYLNEGRAIRVLGWTWLENERAKMLDGQRGIVGDDETGQFTFSGKGVGPFSNERKDFRGVVCNTNDKRRATGGKWIGAGEMIRGVSVVLGRWALLCVSKILGRRGRQTRAPQSADCREAHIHEDSELDDDWPVERTYTRLLLGRPLPDIDESEDYAPSEEGDSDSSEFEDLSVATGAGHYSDSDLTFRPNHNLFQRHLRSPSPDDNPSFAELFDTPARLASLLDPQTPEDRASARLLARHLTAPKVLTRGRYTATMQESMLDGSAEETILENILLMRRKETRRHRRQNNCQSGDADGYDYEDNDEEEDRSRQNAAPNCVVCLTAPRTVIVWPCRCLSLCEDCRVCLAMNNCRNCVTCRQKSIGYSRIYVP